MSIELKIPEVGESVREVQIGRWLKQEGDSVETDENLVELETDKASMELPAPSPGVMSKILKREGDIVAVGDVIGYIEAADADSQSKSDETPNKSRQEATEAANANGQSRAEQPPEDRSSQPTASQEAPEAPIQNAPASKEAPAPHPTDIPVTPAARRELRAHGLTPADIHASGPRIDYEDVVQYVQEHEPQDSGDQQPADEISEDEKPADEKLDEIVPMSLIRRRIAERLVEAQQQAALLTTFNEIDMTAVKQLRSSYRELFQKKYGVKLGFSSFFVKAVVDALKEQPGLNAEIRGNQIVYHRYYHIGVAIGSHKGLVVPVVRDADRLSFAEIERAVEDFAARAAENKLKPEELQGGTFTVTNGGVYGSLLSTPIVNPPQSGVLGMHAIEDRPVAREGQVVIRPMMYVALTYDHRLVDGREAVTFLKRIKDAIEDPARMLLEA